MDIDDFIKECNKFGVDSITETENKDNEDGFKINLKNGDAIYVLFKDEFGDHWTEYKWREKYLKEWENVHFLTPEETKEFFAKTMQTMKERYAPENFEAMLNLMDTKK